MNYLLSPFFMRFIHLYKIIFLFFCNSVYPNISKAIKKMSVNETKNFITIINELNFLRKAVIIQ